MSYESLSGIYADEGLIVYTDGSCHNADRIGGWAWVAVDPIDRMALDAGSARDTTISRMELTAPIQALFDIYEEFGPSTVLVVSDSEYVVLGATDRRRKRNKNVDLWLELDELVDLHEGVEFIHTKGHAGDPGNEIADKLAGEMRLAAKNGDEDFEAMIT